MAVQLRLLLHAGHGTAVGALEAQGYDDGYPKDCDEESGEDREATAPGRGVVDQGSGEDERDQCKSSERPHGSRVVGASRVVFR